MPYLRYRGAKSPPSCSQRIKYEDPNAPCRLGLQTVVAQAWLDAEDQAIEASETAAEVDRRLATANYEGLAHVGGVCFVESPELRECDEIISEAEYLKERKTIAEANEEALRLRKESIERANDTLRRPLPQHEAMPWRTRIVLRSYALLNHHSPYLVGACGIAYMRAQIGVNVDGSILHVVDIYHHGDCPIEDALLLGREAAELFADLLAVVAFGPSEVVQLVSTSPTTCRQNVSFEVATFMGFSINAAVPVLPEHLESSSSISDRQAIHHLRAGLTYKLPADSFAALWNSVEVLATERAVSEGTRRIASCQKCGAERQAGWDTKKGFEAIFADARINEASFDAHRSMRGKIQHGAAAGSIESQRQIYRESGRLRAASMVGVARRYGLVPQTTVLLSPDTWPIVVWTCMAVQSDLVVTQLRYEGMFEPTGLPQRYCGGIGRSYRAGMPTDVQPDALAFPPLVD